MKNRIQKMTLAFLITMSSFFGMVPIKAAAVANVTTSRTGFNYQWSSPGGINGMTAGWAELNKIYADGVLATCFDPATTVNGGPGYDSMPMPESAINKRLSRLAVANDIGNMDNETYAAWQLYQHTIMFAGKGFQVTGTNVPNLQAHYNQFEANAVNYWNKPTFNFGDGTIRAGETKTFDVTNGIMNGWTIGNKTNGLNVSFSNGVLTVVNNNTTDANVRFELVKQIGGYKKLSLLFNKAGSQQLGVLGISDPDFLTVNLTNLRYVDVTLTKADLETGATSQGNASLIGAEYSLFKKDGTLVETKVIPNALKIKFEKLMATEEYYIQETKAPVGYLLNTEKIVIKPIELLTNGSVGADLQYGVTSKENVVKGKVNIIKIGTDGKTGLTNPLANAEFTFKLQSEVNAIGWDNARAYAVVTSNVAGIATTQDLPFGTYVARETFTPVNYITAPDFTVTIDENEKTYSFIINNAPFKSYLKMVKQDVNGNNVTLSSARFKIKDDNGNIVKQQVGNKYVDTFTTDENGEVVTPLMLSAGMYTIEEIETPKGMLTLEQPIAFEITNRNAFEVDEENKPILTVVVKNEKPTAQIIVNKTFEDEKDNGLGGATFKLTANSKIVDPATGDIIYNVGDAVNGLYTIDETGNLLIDGLTMSTGSVSYKLQEVSTLDGYVLDEKEYIINFTQENTTQKVYVQTLEIKNEQTNTEFIKEDANKNNVIGAEMQLVDKHGTVVDSWVTDTNSHVIKGLLVGEEYTLQELIAPEHFVVSKDVKFTVKNTVELQTIKMIDKQVSVAKVDSITNEFVEGARLQITNNKTKQIVDEWISTDEVYYPSNLVEGMEYTLTEVEAPTGFKIADPIIFTVDDDKELQEIVMKDEPILSTVRVNKVDSYTNKSIKSKYFVFGIFKDKNCEKMIDKKDANTIDGTVDFKELRFGTYYISELQAPLGYKKSDKVVEIVINEEGVFADGKKLDEVNNVYSFTYGNQMLPIIQTGDNTNVVYYVQLLMGSICLLLFVFGCKKARS